MCLQESNIRGNAVILLNLPMGPNFDLTFDTDCANTVQNGGIVAPDGLTGCNMLCNGNKSSSAVGQVDLICTLTVFPPRLPQVA
jgi:hypothetical protein